MMRTRYLVFRHRRRFDIRVRLRNRTYSQQAGFTLVEVLIALAIVGIALAAFVRVTAQTTGNIGQVEQRTLALLSAENSLAELKIGTPPPPGIHRVACPQANLPLLCRVQIGTARNGVYAVSVNVYLGNDDDTPLAGLQTQLPERRQ